MSVNTLVNDPEFEKLPPSAKKVALASVDPEFSGLQDDKVDAVVQGIKGDGKSGFRQFGENLMTDLKANNEGAKAAASYAIPGMNVVQALQGNQMYSPERLKAMGQGVMNIPGQMAHEALHPIESFKERPISTAMDLSTFGGGAADVARMATGAISKRVLPGILKPLAGIPENATEMALRKPEIFKTPAAGPEQLNQAVGGPIIGAIKAAKANVQGIIGKAFQKYAEMEGPKTEIVDKPLAQKLRKIESEVPVAQELKRTETKDVGTGLTKVKFEPGDVLTGKEVSYKPGAETTVDRPTHSYDDLLFNHKTAVEAFDKGDQIAMVNLAKKYISDKRDYEALPVTNSDQLQILTRLKRETQAQAQFNRAPITNAPIDSAKDAAFKEISSNTDRMRGKLPNGQKLAAADDAWKQINDIYDTVQNDLSDPGKARDTIMRMVRGDNTWLTSGRMKGKVDAIRRAEQISGKKILDPAMEELTRQVFNEWSGKGFVSQFIKGAGVGATIMQPHLWPGLIAAFASSSPKVIRSGIRASAGIGKVIRKIPVKQTATAGGASSIARALYNASQRDKK